MEYPKNYQDIISYLEFSINVLLPAFDIKLDDSLVDSAESLARCLFPNSGISFGSNPPIDGKVLLCLFQLIVSREHLDPKGESNNLWINQIIESRYLESIERANKIGGNNV